LGYPEEYVRLCLEYSEPLVRLGVPVIFEPEHFSRLVGYRAEYVLGAAYATGRFYRTFEIPKRRGGKRKISAPLPSLMAIQRWVLYNILASTPPSRFAKGFVAGSSIVDNARFHRRMPMILSVDLEDFFPSI